MAPVQTSTSISCGRGKLLGELKSDSVNLGGFLQKTVVIVGLESDDPNAPLNVIYLRFVSNACESWH